MAGMGAANNDSHAERSKQLDDIVQSLAADSGMKTRTMTYRCSPDDPETSLSVPYKSEACAAAKQNWFSVYACNDIEHMSAANQQCLEACGNAGCDER